MFVPASCTGELQPLDLTVNYSFKESVKASFTNWYAQQVTVALDNEKSVEDVDIRLNIARIKPLHAKWLIQAHSLLQDNLSLIYKGFIKSGIY